MIEQEASEVGVSEANARPNKRVDRSVLGFGSDRGNFPASPTFENLQRL
jgi:hypothetical protein